MQETIPTSKIRKDVFRSSKSEIEITSGITAERKAETFLVDGGERQIRSVNCTDRSFVCTKADKTV